MPDSAYITISVVMFTIINNDLKVILIHRSKAPFLWYRALPWWYLLPDKSAEQTIMLKLFHKIGILNPYLEQIHVFTDPYRDNRYRAINISYLSAGIYNNIKDVSSYGEVSFHSIKKLPQLAFDHQEVISYAHRILQQKLIQSNIAQFFLSKQFTLTELQLVYDCIQWVSSDVRNFRNFIKKQSSIRDTGKQQSHVWHRPARLYEFISRDIKISDYS